MSAVEIIAGVGLVAWLYLVLLHGGFWLTREREDAHDSRESQAAFDWPSVVAVVPARNEADVLPQSLASLAAQNYPGEFSIVLVDDQSSDGTADVARRVAAEAGCPITVVSGTPLPSGWTGKVWVMHQGIAVAGAGQSSPQYFLLTDADIGYEPGVLMSLVRRASGENRVLTSVMAKLKLREFCGEGADSGLRLFFQDALSVRMGKPRNRENRRRGGRVHAGRAPGDRAGRRDRRYSRRFDRRLHARKDHEGTGAYLARNVGARSQPQALP